MLHRCAAVRQGHRQRPAVAHHRAARPQHVVGRPPRRRRRRPAGGLPHRSRGATDPKQAKAQREPFHTWTADELGCFLRTWDEHRFGPLWHLLAATGLRRGEALGLRWRDVDLTAGTVSIRQTVGSDKDQHGNRRTFIQPTVKSGRRT